CHLARTVCRRAERALLRLSRDEPVNSASIKYLNRLSDLLFVLARVLARRDGGAEVTWQKGI
ncbi:MAG: ATP:cob(I)alamin adenosyltransferase, partial [Sedimenticolaceae bacterium]